ncbi:MAG: B12-binding domain-containing radical SAM protein [Candidatus Omnitrophota bacterium]
MNNNNPNDSIFKGRWIVRYQPEEFSYKEILLMLVTIEDGLTKNENHCFPDYTRFKLSIRFRKNISDNRFFLKSDTIEMELKNGDLSHLQKVDEVDQEVDEKNDDELEPSFNHPLWSRPIKTMALCYPIQMGDKRWNSIHLTGSSLFLGSSLANAGIAVTTAKIPMPGATPEPELLSSDVLGFTLFEDLFLPTRELINRMKPSVNGLLAAGGPLVTLTPMQTAFHLEDIHVLVRGEAERVLPEILQAIEANDPDRLLTFKGLLVHVPGTVIISDFDQINRPTDFSDFRFNLNFAFKNPQEAEALGMGLELNISRGCRRGCTFCSAVQGKTLRTLPLTALDDLFTQFNRKLETFGIDSPHARTVNINDDDILQDPAFASAVFQTIKANGFRIWGIQTSIDALRHEQTLELLADPSLFVDDQPMVWVGTDAFLPSRGKRLGKTIPPEDQLIRLMEELEAHGVRHYHYWISSDHRSDWEEFIRELQLIYRLHTRFPSFGFIAHAPFVVPYLATPLYRLLTRGETNHSHQIRYKKILDAPGIFRFPLVDRVETAYRNLNRLLANERLDNRDGFFDALGRKDFPTAWITAYTFLKQERLEMGITLNSETVSRMTHLERDVEAFISQLL